MTNTLPRPPGTIRLCPTSKDGNLCKVCNDWAVLWRQVKSKRQYVTKTYWRYDAPLCGPCAKKHHPVLWTRFCSRMVALKMQGYERPMSNFFF